MKSEGCLSQPEWSLCISTPNPDITSHQISYLEPESPLSPGVGDGEEGEKVAAEAEENVERVEDHGKGRGPSVTLN